MKNEVKVLYIQGVTRYGGALESLYQLVSHPALFPFSPLVVTSGEGLLTAKLEAAGIRHAVVPSMGMWRKAKNWVKLPITLQALKGLAKREDVGLVHCNTLWDAPYGIHLGKRLKVPVVVHLRNTFTPDKIPKYNLQRADMVITVSRAVAEPLAGLTHPPHQVIYNGVDLGIFDPSTVDPKEVRRELGIEPGIPVLLVVGRVDTTKGQDVAINALSLFSSNNMPYLLIAGEASAHEHRWPGVLRGLAEELGVSHRVRFLGNRQDIPMLMGASDVVLVPSLESAREGFGRVAMEAMAMERPVVASNTGGLREVVNEECGILVPPGDAEALARAVRRLVEHPEEGRRLGENGRLRAKELFDLEITVNQVKGVYQKLLKERGEEG